MAALNRPTQATYAVHDEISVETQDNEDHTFCGIMFPVRCKAILPVHHIVLHSVAVRGRLGPMTVWVSNDSNTTTVPLHPRHWTKLHDANHAPSHHTFAPLQLNPPIQLLPGQIKTIYIHSTLPGDEAIVYDKQRSRSRRIYDDPFLTILSGRAHVSNTPFGTTPIWGWGNPWRDSRVFVGRLDYGAVYHLWSPNTKQYFGPQFHAMAITLFLCQRKYASPISFLPDDVLFYILHMCRWDWAKDTTHTMKQQHQHRRQQQQQQHTRQDQPVGMESLAPMVVLPVVNNHDNHHDDEEEDDDDDNDEEDEEYYEEEENNDDEEDEDDTNNNDASTLQEEDDSEQDSGLDSDSEYTGINENVFTIHDDDSEEGEEEEEKAEAEPPRGRIPWMARTLARVHVLQALAQLDDASVVHPHAASNV